jgi:hypothetical protein
MPPARPLRDVFADLTGDGAAVDARPDDLLRAQGHDDLGADLVAEAVVSYADTAPPEVAEHLAPFVMAHSPVPPLDHDAAGAQPPGWVDLLASAPAGADLPDLTDADLTDAGFAESGPAGFDDLGGPRADTGLGLDTDHAHYLDFGYGDADAAGPVGPAVTGVDADDPRAQLDADDLSLSVYDGQPGPQADGAGLEEFFGAVEEPAADAGDDPADTLDS